MSFKQWLYRTPLSMRKEHNRFYLFMNYAYIVAFFCHVALLVPLYTMLNSPVAFWSNTVCIVMDVVCFYLLRRGAMNVSFLLFLAVVSSHITLSILFFGATSGLPIYFFTLLVISFFAPWKLSSKVVTGIVLAGFALCLTTYSLYHPSLIEVTPLQLVFWNSGNVLVNCFAMGYGVYYFSFLVDTAEEKLRYQAEHDILTGILNRNAIVKVLVSNIARAQNYSIAAIMGDIDYFKKINDTYGHLVGDEVLINVSQILSSSLREGDAVGRFGGEEFIMVLPGCNMSVAVRVAERVRALIAASSISTETGEIHVTMSFGVAVMQEGRGEDGEELLKRADEALYRAKNNGRNRVEYI